MRSHVSPKPGQYLHIIITFRAFDIASSHTSSVSAAMKLVTGRRVVLGDDDVGPASIAIEDGKIVNVWRVYRCTDVARFDEVRQCF